MKDSEGIPATMSERARGRSKTAVQGLGEPGDRVKPKTSLHVRARDRRLRRDHGDVKGKDLLCSATWNPKHGAKLRPEQEK